MHILIVPGAYPTKKLPTWGIFMKAPINALLKKGVKIGVIFSEGIMFRELEKNTPENEVPNKSFHMVSSMEDGVITYRSFEDGRYETEEEQMQAFVAAQRQLADKYIQEQGKPDLLHAFSVIWGGLSTFHIHEKYKIPYVLTEQWSGYLLPDIGLKFAHHDFKRAYRHAAAITVNSSALKRVLKDYFDIQQEIVIVPCSIDIEQFPLPANKKAPPPFELIAIGRVVDTKNHELLLHAFKMALAKDPELRLRIIGEGNKKEYIRNLIKKLDLDQYVALLPRQSQLEIRDQLHQCHAMVLPSKTETFGVAGIEALATGMPIIATKCGGPEDYVNEDNGILVDNYNIQAFSEGILRIKKNYSKYNPLKIREHIVSNFDKKMAGDHYFRVYKNLLGE